MSERPDESQGIGTPSGSRPGFAPPASGPTARPWPPTPPNAEPPPGPGPLTQPTTPQQPWAAPDPRLVVPAPPPGRSQRTVTRPRGRFVAAVLAAALVLIGFLSAPPLLPGAPVQPQQAATPLPVVTATPSAIPGNASTASTGGDLGAAIAFRTSSVSGTVTVHSAVWTDAGEMVPEPGRRYLVLDVTVNCRTGTLPVESIMFVAVTPEGQDLPGFGPTLSTPLGGRVLEAGESVHGQVGYSLVPGEVTVSFLDATLESVAEIRIPAP